MKSLLSLILALMLAGCGAVQRDPSVLLAPAAPAPSPSQQARAAQPPAEPEPDPAEAALDRLMDAMTVEQKVGQLFLIRCPETSPNEVIERLQPGGVILFARDFENKTAQEVISTLGSYQQSATVPLLLAVDEEGGTVNRVSRNPQLCDEPFRSPSALFAAGGYERIAADTREKCELLRSLGLNVNVAPVCDVTTTSKAFMAPRAFGIGAQQTAEYVKTVVAEMKAGQVGSVLKHFPGYGDAADSHTDVTWDRRGRESFEQSDLLPFQAGIEAGAGAVMVCHNIVTAFDDTTPASLSPAVHALLRDELGFEGVIVTDDLMMEAVRKPYGTGEAAVLAVLAGNDLLCSSEYEAQLPAVLEAVRAGRVTEDALDAAVRRVLRWKLDLGLIAIDR